MPTNPHPFCYRKELKHQVFRPISPTLPQVAEVNIPHSLDAAGEELLQDEMISRLIQPVDNFIL